MTTIALPSGASLWYKKTGSGLPLLQIHGSAFGHRNFEKVTPIAARHYEVIDFDLPGYGESRSGTPLRDMGAISDLVCELIHGLGYARLNVHGTSFGAMIAVNLAARHPEVVDHLVLSCFLARYDRAARMMRATWKRAARESGMSAVADLTSVAGFARGYYDRPEAEAQFASMREAFAKTTPEAFISGTEAIERTDLSELIPKITAPVLLIGGREDNMTPFRPSPSGVGFSTIETLLPGSSMVVLDDCGHYLVIEQPEKTVELITKFIV
jgi:pimeloyl-ACP methyl ester carboxylesterase